MSENARGRYGEVQKLLARVVANYGSLHVTQTGRLSGKTYEDLQETCSALRTALTEDLETRAQRSVLRSVSLIWRHWRQGLRAKKRIRRAGGLPEEPERFEMEQWQRPHVSGRTSLVAKQPEKERPRDRKWTRWLGH